MRSDRCLTAVDRHAAHRIPLHPPKRAAAYPTTTGIRHLAQVLTEPTLTPAPGPKPERSHVNSASCDRPPCNGEAADAASHLEMQPLAAIARQTLGLRDLSGWIRFAVTLRRREADSNHRFPVAKETNFVREPEPSRRRPKRQLIFRVPNPFPSTSESYELAGRDRIGSQHGDGAGGEIFAQQRHICFRRAPQGWWIS